MYQAGFIGLGAQGAPMAESISRRIKDFIVYDLRDSACRPFADRGIPVASSPVDLVKNCETVVVCVLNDKQCAALCLGADGIIAAMQTGTTLVLTSTISLDMVKELAAATAAKGVGFLDAPVTGKTLRAREEGTLTIFVGGEAQTYDKALPVLEAMGSTVTLLGDHGAGTVGKLCNNLMLICNTIGAFEAARLGKAYGLGEERLMQLCNEGSGASWALQEWGYIDRLKLNHTLRDDDQALLDFLQKDMTMALKAASEKDVALPFSSAGEEMMRPEYQLRWDAMKS